MKKHWKPILALILISSILPEVLSENTPITVMLQPQVLLIFCLVGYGIPVLFIRELARRWRLGISGIFWLGAAYSLWNEGIVAKKIIFTANMPLPVEALNGYARFLDLNTAWATFLLPWHAITSVILPIIFVYALFPSKRDEPWIGFKTISTLTVLAFTFGLLIFFSPAFGVTGSVTQLLFLVGTALFFTLLARAFPGTRIEEGRGTRLSTSTFILGFIGMYLVEFVGLYVAHLNLPWFIYYGWFVIGFWILCRAVVKRRLLTITGLTLLGIPYFMGIAIASAIPPIPLFLTTALVAVVMGSIVLYRFNRAQRRTTQ